MAVLTDTQAYSARMLESSQINVGHKSWAIFTKTDRFSKLEEDVRTLKQDVENLKKDAVTYGAIFLCMTATQALLFAAGDVSQEYLNKRFTKMYQAQDARLLQYTQVVNQQQPFAVAEEAVATGLDKIINERNSMVHFRTEAGFYQSYILPAQALLKRHPTLQ